MKLLYDLAMYTSLALGAAYGPYTFFLLALPIALACAIAGGLHA